MLQLREIIFIQIVCFCLFFSGNSLADPLTKTATCAACHGKDGNSPNGIWPSLAGQGAKYLAQQITAYKSGTRKNASMTPLAMMVADEDIREISDYYANQPPSIADIGDFDYTDAEKLYRGGDIDRNVPACMACHGPTGSGNAPAAYPALRGQHSEYTVAQLKAYKDGTRTTDPQAMMRDIAKKLTEKEMISLGKYISALH
mgnify:CR=1 FL=1